jgi:hypothetical protein
MSGSICVLTGAHIFEVDGNFKMRERRISRAKSTVRLRPPVDS